MIKKILIIVLLFVGLKVSAQTNITPQFKTNGNVSALDSLGAFWAGQVGGLHWYPSIPYLRSFYLRKVDSNSTDRNYITKYFFNHNKGVASKAYIDSLNAAIYANNHTFTGDDIFSGLIKFTGDHIETTQISAFGDVSAQNGHSLQVRDVANTDYVGLRDNGSGTVAFIANNDISTGGIIIDHNNIKDFNGVFFLKASGTGAGALKDSSLQVNKNLYDLADKTVSRTNLSVYSTAQTDAGFIKNTSSLQSSSNFFISGIGTIGDGVSSIRSTNYKMGVIKAVNPADGLNDHVFVANVNFTKTTSGLAIADYDGFDSVGDNTAAINYDHHVVYQARTKIDIGNTNTLTNLYGAFTTPSIVTGIVTNAYGSYIKGPALTAGASLVNNTGLFIQGLTNGSGKVRAILTGNNISTLGDVESSNTLATGSMFRFVAGSSYVSEGGFLMDGVANTVSNIHMKVRTISAVTNPDDTGTSEVFGVYGGSTNYALFSSGLRSVSTGIPYFNGSSSNATYISGTSSQVVFSDGSKAALSGDITNAAGVTTIGANKITYAKLQAGTTNRVLSTGTGTAYVETTAAGSQGVSATWGATSLTVGLGAITPTSINTVHLPANTFQTPVGASTDSVAVKNAATGKLSAVKTLGVSQIDTANLATHTYTARYATINGSPTFVTQAVGDNSTKAATTAYADRAAPISGSFSGVGTATTVFTVTIGTTQANNTYKVQVTPTSVLSAALFYVTNKTTTTFDVTYMAGLTGTVTFDWGVFK